MTRKWVFVLIVLLSCLLFFSAARPLEGLGRVKDITRKIPKNNTKNFSTRDVSTITGTVIHHTAGPADQSVESVAAYHSGPNHVCDSGCAGILYHLVIDRNANVYLTQPLSRITHHTLGHNAKKAAVCLIGNYNDLEITPQIAKAIRHAIRYIERKTGNDQIVSAHRDHRPTSCPGANVKLNQII